MRCQLVGALQPEASPTCGGAEDPATSNINNYEEESECTPISEVAFVSRSCSGEMDDDVSILSEDGFFPLQASPPALVTP